MEKERRIKVLSMVALIVAVLGLTVAFASLSQTLTINGTATVNAASWDVHFESVQDSNVELLGDATSSSEPKLSGTTISGIDVSVTKPGDKFVYEFDIVNDGTIDAYIDNYLEFSLEINKQYLTSNPDLTYDFNGDGYVTLDDSKYVLAAIKYGLYYEDEITKVAIGDTLNAKERKRVKLIIEYRQEASTIFNNPIKIFNDATATIDYVQAE